MLDRATIERAKVKAAGGPIIMALSGGGDSTALLHLLVDELGAARLHALVIDHALREGSAQDALRAKALAEGLNVPSEILTLDWPDGPKRAQQAARRARYAALCDAARKLGASVIALAHTADDQAETVFMRAAAGSGWRGLAGMAAIAPAPIWPEGRGIELVRPLLNTRRAGLRSDLRVRGAMWIEDPANTNPAFERVRVRMRLAELASQGFDPMRLCALAAGLRPAADTLNNAAAGLIAQAVRFKADRIVIEASCWRGDAQVRQRVLAVLLAAAAGVERAPPPMAVARLEARLLETTFFGATLAGAALTRKRDVIAIGRDLGAVQGRAGGPTPLPRLSLEPGAEAVWDGRLALTAPEPGWSVEAGANGAPVLAKGDQIQPVEAAPVRWRWLLEDHMRHLVEAG